MKTTRKASRKKATPRARAARPKPSRTAFVILEYCGGARTDALHGALSRWNPGHIIHVLDNGSPSNRATCVTHRNEVNSFIGGGIRDCMSIARSLGASYLFYCVNDLEIVDPLVIEDFEGVLERDPDAVMITCALTADSHQSTYFPWMTRRRESGLRRVRFGDLLCCLLRLDFVESFGGFPVSYGGWGYATEIAFHAERSGRRLYVNDGCAVRHLSVRDKVRLPNGAVVHKGYEAKAVYAPRYGHIRTIRAVLDPPDFDEEAQVRFGTTRRRTS